MSEPLVTPRFVLIVASGLAYFFALSMLTPVLPLYIKGPLHGNGLSVGVGVGAFAVGAVLLRPYAGKIGDRAGRRWLVIGGALVVSVSIAGYGLIDSLRWLVFARLVTGLGEAAFFVGAATMITDLAPPERRGEALSYWSTAVYGGLAFGPALGELVLGHDRYVATWLVASGLAFVAALVGFTLTETATSLQPGAAAARVISATHDGEAHADATGRTGAAAARVISATHDGEAHADATGRTGAAAAGATSATRDGEAHADATVKLIHPAAVRPGIVLMLGLIGLAGFSAFVSLYARDELGLSGAGVIFVVYGVCILLVRVVGARLPDRLGPIRAGTYALVFGAGGLAVMALARSVAGLVVGTVIFALGMSLLYPALLVMALSGAPDSERASVVGTFSSFFDLSQGLGAVLCGAAQQLFGYRAAFATGAVLAAAGCVALRSGVSRRAGTLSADPVQA
jgi:MFS family permease